MSVRSLNKVMLIGNLTRDVEMKYTSTNTAIASFGIATNKSWKDQNGEQQESVEYHNLVAWSKMAEICGQLLQKGMKVYIEGELNTRSWEGDDGVTKYKTEVRVNDMILLDSKGKVGGAPNGDAGAPASAAPAPAKPAAAPAQDDAPVTDSDPTEDDLPF